MANLAAIGRARPTRVLGDVLQAKFSSDANERQAQLTTSRLALESEQLRQIRQKAEWEQAEHEKLNTAHPWSEMAATFYGGEEGNQAKFAENYLKQRGLLGTVGGYKTYTVADIRVGMAEFSKDQNANIEFIQIGMDDSVKKIRAINEELANKPGGDEKLQAQLQQARAEHARFTNLMDFANKQFETEKEEARIKKAEDLAERTVGAKEAAVNFSTTKYNETQAFNKEKFEETKRHNLVMEKKKTGGSTLKEREIERRKGILSELQKLDPNEVYKLGYQVDDAGNIVTDLETGAPIKLPPFTDALGKRGGPTALKAAGEYYDDAQELRTLLSDPQVAQDLRAASNAGYWDRTIGSFSNRIQEWLSKHHIAANSPTSTAIRRMQRMASEERKSFLGSAVTATELESTLGWMPSAGDSYDAMLNKVNLIYTEGKQEFKRFLDIYKDVANMTPWYDAFGFKRVGDSTPTAPARNVRAADMSDDELLKGILE